MRQAWRWFGPGDPVTLDAVRQAGATDTVSAFPLGEAWTLADTSVTAMLSRAHHPDTRP